MAKVNCAVCGAEIGIIKRVQLGDRSEICRDCLKKTSPYYEPQRSSLVAYQEHMKQLEDGKKLFDAYFAKNNKAAKFGGKKIFVDEETALIAFAAKRGQIIIFGGTPFYMVMRIADIDDMELVTKETKNSEGKVESTTYARFLFRNVAGLYDFEVPLFANDFKRLGKVIDKYSGKRGIKGLKKSFATDIANAKAVAGIVGNFKEAMANANDEEAVAEQAAAARDAAEEMFYNGKEEIVKRADEAIAKVLG